MLEDSAPRFRAKFPLFSLLRARLPKKLGAAFLLVVPLLMVRACTMKYVRPDEIGLRQISFGPNRGLQKEVVGTGYRREIAGFETIRTFPRDLQVIEFTNNPTEASKEHRVVSAINVPTVDGYPVSIDVTVLYRIVDPFAVVSRFGFSRSYEDNVVIRFTDPAVKKNLGELRAEDFYREARLRQVQKMKKELAERFKENGLMLSDILVRQYYYPETFQALTEQKKMQDQSVLTNQQVAKQAEVQTRLNQVSAEGQNYINIKTSEFQAKITEINAQKELYERQKRAEADLLVRSAEANGTELINRAMEGPGSAKLLKLRKGLAMINAIKGPIYITEDPTDLGKLAKE